jgi:hypothetical protein
MPRLVLSSLLAALIGCAQQFDLADQFRRADLHLPFEQRLRFELAAPLIVLGRVVSLTEVGGPRPSAGAAPIKVQLTRIRIEVEDVVKGAVAGNALDFYYFVYSPDASETDLGVPRYLPALNQHRVFFLKEVGGVYRSVGDVTDYTLRVSSGTFHRGFCQGKSPGCCIAEILLSPQEDVNRDLFVSDLVSAEYCARVLCTSQMARDLLLELTRGSDERIAARAREVISGTRRPITPGTQGRR